MWREKIISLVNCWKAFDVKQMEEWVLHCGIQQQMGGNEENGEDSSENKFFFKTQIYKVE